MFGLAGWFVFAYSFVIVFCCFVCFVCALILVGIYDVCGCLCLYIVLCCVGLGLFGFDFAILLISWVLLAFVWVLCAPVVVF